MKRKSTKEDIINAVSLIRETFKTSPYAIYISADIIVGFPTETEQDFNETLNIVKELEFDDIDIFAYSPRDGTPAAEMSQIPKHEITARAEKVYDVLGKGNLMYFHHRQ